MKFRTKMVSIFTIFVVIIAAASSFFMHYFLSKQYYEEQYHTINMSVMDMAHNFEMKLNSMNSVMRYVLSNGNILNDLAIISASHKNTQLLSERNNALDEIREYINNDYIYKTSYRTIVFNNEGEAVSSKNFGDTEIKEHWQLKDIQGIETAQKTPGKTYLTGTSKDQWGNKSNPEVFSLLKCLNGSQYGYIEIQCLVEDIMALDKEKDVKFIIYDDSHNLIYASDKIREPQKYVSYLKKMNTIQNVNGKIIYAMENETYGYSLVGVYTGEEIASKSIYIVAYTGVIELIFILLAIGFVVISARYLTKPIEDLKAVIDRTEMEDLDAERIIAVPKNEIEAVNVSYQKLLERLHKSIVKEEKMANLSLKSQLDMLQAQINPHFIYNVLNVLSNRGILAQDEEICNICGNLAAMLRYSTDTREYSICIRDELDYLHRYISLIKARFEHRIEYSEEIEHSLMDQKIPKAVIQQLVENSVEHGFGKVQDVLQIKIYLESMETGWSLKVQDNGVGFSEEKKQELYVLFEEIKTWARDEKQIYGKQLGGMGLASVYARMYFMFGEQFHIELSNRDGAQITITVEKSTDEYKI